MGPALGEGRAVATALSSLAQQPDASATITRTLFVGLAMIESTAIYCFVVSMILIFANPFWNHVIAQAAGKVDHAHRLVHRRCAGAQLSHPGVVDEALSLQAHPPRHRCAGKRIAAELADADAKRPKPKGARRVPAQERGVRPAARGALEQATDEAKAERQRLLDEARQAADALSAKRQEALRNEPSNLNQAIRRRTQQEVFAIARKALTDLATTSLEERLGEVFTRRLREMDGEAKPASPRPSRQRPTRARAQRVRPAAEQRAAIQNALNETFSAEIHVRFETAPDLISGIELTTNGQKVAWSIADYLASLEKGVDELLKEKDKHGTAEAVERFRPCRTPPEDSSPLPRGQMSAPPRFIEPMRACLRPALCRHKPGAGSIHAATDAAGGGHDHQRLHRHRQGLGSARRGL
jgi:F-type H+-transporting ATPase subunit b